MSSHPSHEALAQLVDGNLSWDERQLIERHLATCASCRSAYQEVLDVVLRHHGKEPEPLPATMREAAFNARDPLRAGGHAEAQRPRKVALAVAGTALVAGLAVTTWWWSRPTPPASTLSARRSILESSARGLVLPGGEEWAARSLPDYRGGENVDESGDSLTQAALTSLSEKGSADDAVWALSAFVAQGRLRIARTFALSARRRFPEDQRLVVLDTVIAYRDGRLQQSEDLLRGVLAREPDDLLARLDLAIVLNESARAGEAREHLRKVQADAKGSPLAERARRILEQGR